MNERLSGMEFGIAFLVTLVSYSHLIPISLYVAVETLKLILTWQINKKVTVDPNDLTDSPYKVQIEIPDKMKKVVEKRLTRSEAAEKEIKDAKKLEE